MTTSLSAAPASRRADILMIEDDPDFQRLVERWLETSADPHFEVQSATRLDEAWHRIGCSDLILLDLGLPDSAGMETLVAARELAPDLPIVVLTGLDDDDLVRRALLAGADAFVPKRGADPQTLHVALRRALAAHDAKPPPEEEAAPDRKAPSQEQGAAQAGRAQARDESGTENFWIDARYGSDTERDG